MLTLHQSIYEATFDHNLMAARSGGCCCAALSRLNLTILTSPIAQPCAETSSSSSLFASLPHSFQA